MSRPPRRRLPEKKPWSMKWIIAAILVCVVPYTYVNLKFRKPNPAHEPYQDNKDRAGVMRLLAAGYHRIELAARKPMDPRHFPLDAPPAVTRGIPGGLPPMLSETLIDKPLVPAAVLSVRTPARTRSDATYTLQFSCNQPDHGEHFATARAYRRGNQVTILPAFEPLQGDLQSRFLETTVNLTFPAGTLAPGTYQLTLVGARGSQTWPLDVTAP